MEIVIVETVEELNRVGAAVFAGVAAEKPDAAVVLDTGDTPMGMCTGKVARRRRARTRCSG